MEIQSPLQNSQEKMEIIVLLQLDLEKL